MRDTGYRPPGFYEPGHDHDVEEPGQGVPARVARPPYPGSESAGPPLTELYQYLDRVSLGLEMLYRQARSEVQERLVNTTKAFQTDANGDGCVDLLSVPQGATGYLMLCAIDEEGRTPSNPDTSANLFHGIYHASGAGITNAAQVIAQGTLLDASPIVPTIDTQIPFVYTYGDRYGAPALMGPETFYLVVDAATATRKISVVSQILVCTPEP